MTQAEISFLTQFMTFEPMRGNLFQEMKKWKLPDGQSLIGKEIVVNGMRSKIMAACFQESIGQGFIDQHSVKKNEQVMFFLSGAGSSELLDQQLNPVERSLLNGFLSREEATEAQYQLAVAQDIPSKGEHFVLNVTTRASRLISLYPIITPRTFHNRIELHTSSLFFVMEHEPIAS